MLYRWALLHKWALLMSLLMTSAAMAQQVEEQLHGQPASFVENMLGEPNLVRPEAPAYLWLYESDLCALTIYLYEPPLGGEPVVDHMEARMRGDNSPPMGEDQVRECLMAMGADKKLAPPIAETPAVEEPTSEAPVTPAI